MTDMVDGNERFRQDARIPKRATQHVTPDPHAGGLGGERPHQGNGFHLRPAGIASQRRVEMIPNRHPIQSTSIRHFPCLAHFVVGAMLLSGVDAKMHAPSPFSFASRPYDGLLECAPHVSRSGAGTETYLATGL